MMNSQVREIIRAQINGERKISFLVGAGLSVDSGIPVFRGEDGYWTDGSINYTPQEIGTYRMFQVNANEVWRWYLYRLSVCNNAKPNKGHILLAKIEKKLDDRFSLISQNVDGLHFRDESKINNLFLIHGDLRFMRCSEECSKELFEIPSTLLKEDRTRKTPLTFAETKLLICPNCGEMTRPHVLWFDEFYDDTFYHLAKVLRIAKQTGILFVIGTSGATNLPKRIVKNTIRRQGVVIDVNPNDNEFTDHFKRLKNGYSVKMRGTEFLLELNNILEVE